MKLYIQHLIDFYWSLKMSFFKIKLFRALKINKSTYIIKHYNNWHQWIDLMQILLCFKVLHIIKSLLNNLINKKFSPEKHKITNRTITFCKDWCVAAFLSNSFRVLGREPGSAATGCWVQCAGVPDSAPPHPWESWSTL